MRILQVDHISTTNNCSNVRGLSGAYARAGQLYTFDYRLLANRHGKDAMNEMLIECANEVQPGLIHIEKGENLRPSTIKHVRECTDAKIMYVFPDRRSSPPEYVVGACPYCDYVLFPFIDPSWDKRCAEAGCTKTAFWTRGVDPKTFRPYRKERKYDLVMMAHKLGKQCRGVGQGYRTKFIRRIAEAGLSVDLFGSGNQAMKCVTRHSPVYMEGFAKTVSQAQIALAYNTNKVRMYTSWRRPLNTMASGCFVLIHYFPGLEYVFKNRKHLVWFKSYKEAIDLARYYLEHSNERKQIAIQGMKEVNKYHTWDIRVERMLNLAFRDEDQPIFWRYK